MSLLEITFAIDPNFLTINDWIRDHSDKINTIVKSFYDVSRVESVEGSVLNLKIILKKDKYEEDDASPLKLTRFALDLNSLKSSNAQPNPLFTKGTVLVNFGKLFLLQAESSISYDDLLIGMGILTPEEPKTTAPAGVVVEQDASQVRVIVTKEDFDKAIGKYISFKEKCCDVFNQRKLLFFLDGIEAERVRYPTLPRPNAISYAKDNNLWIEFYTLYPGFDHKLFGRSIRLSWSSSEPPRGYAVNSVGMSSSKKKWIVSFNVNQPEEVTEEFLERFVRKLEIQNGVKGFVAFVHFQDITVVSDAYRQDCMQNFLTSTQPGNEKLKLPDNICTDTSVLEQLLLFFKVSQNATRNEAILNVVSILGSDQLLWPAMLKKKYLEIYAEARFQKIFVYDTMREFNLISGKITPKMNDFAPSSLDTSNYWTVFQKYNNLKDNLSLKEIYQTYHLFSEQLSAVIKPPMVGTGGWLEGIDIERGLNIILNDVDQTTKQLFCFRVLFPIADGYGKTIPCNIDGLLDNPEQATKKKFGLVFNTNSMDSKKRDERSVNEAGSHWVCVFAEINDVNKIVVIDYFNSLGSRYSGESARIYANIKTNFGNKFQGYAIVEQQLKVKKQKDGSQCGVYCILFLHRRLIGQSMQTIAQDNSLNDDFCLKTRTMLWRDQLIPTTVARNKNVLYK